MSKIQELLHEGRHAELWQMCCGFLDLNLEQFMTIQKQLMLEQIELLKNCKLGTRLMRGAIPETVDEFREQVPLTTYSDYYPELPEYREDVLPERPVIWQHTAGRSVEYSFRLTPYKWVPLTSRFCHELGILMYGSGILASCRGRGDVSGAREHAKIVYTVAPRPYTSGVMTYIMEQLGVTDLLPPLEEAEQMDFEDRTELGFKQALIHGLDYFFGLPIVLVALGERLNQRSDKIDMRSLLSQPKILLRLVRGLVRSKIARRPILPRDLWSISGIMSGGTDCTVLKEKIKKLWGKYPLDTYSCTEAGIIATQAWDFDSMTFIPNLNFLEFIPESEYSKWQSDNSYQPRTVLLDEVKAGENYEMVITNFHGGAMVRYRMADVIKISSLKNEKLGIDIPQMAFEGRLNDVMDVGGLVRLTEKTIWQAIDNTNIPYEDWTARKEIVGGRPVLHLYIELKDGHIASERGMATAVFEQLVKYDEGTFYGSLAQALDPIPIEVTLLPEGAFVSYIAKRRTEGADLAHLKPRHINPSDAELSVLVATVEVAPKVEVAVKAKAVAGR